MPQFPQVQGYGADVIFGEISLNESEVGWDTGTARVYMRAYNTLDLPLYSGSGTYPPGSAVQYLSRPYIIPFDYHSPGDSAPNVSSSWFPYNVHNRLSALFYMGQTAWKHDELYYFDEIEGGMYPVSVNKAKANGYWNLDVGLKGCIRAFDATTKIAKLRRTFIDATLEQAVVQAPNTAYVAETQSFYVHSGDDWHDTQITGNPGPRQPIVSGRSSLPSPTSYGISGGGASVGITLGGKARYSYPRHAFEDVYIARYDASPTAQQRNWGFKHVGWGTVGYADESKLGGISGVNFDTFQLPVPSVYTTPPDLDGLNVPFGWVLTSRHVEPLLDSRPYIDGETYSSRQFLVADQFTYYQDVEFM